MARAIRSIAADMSRSASGSCRSSKAGRRKCCALSASVNPRCARTFAAGAARRKASRSALTICGSGDGNSQRVPPLILGEIPAKGIALVEILFSQVGGDLVFHGQVFFVPVGLQLVHVEPRIVIESQFQRTGLAL